MLQPSGALTDAANVISKLNNERLLKALPPPKGVEYQQMLDKFSDLSKLDRMNELKSAYEVGGSRNSIINNIANRIFHRFGYQLSAEAMDKLSDIISAANNAARPNPAAPFGVSKILQRFRNDQ
jgi:DNA mismatch repair ATPase MutL